MSGIFAAIAQAVQLIGSADPDLLEIVGLSLRVSLCGVLIACLIGFPLGALLGALRFPGRAACLALLNAAMGLPPVTVGLFVYLMLSASGPLGVLGLLYSPTAMIIAQSLLVTPIVAALSARVITDLNSEYGDFFASLALRPSRRIATLLWEARSRLTTVALAGFGRAIAEVGAVIIVGGNINHLTRVMTTSIALETSKGNLELALALGIVLLVIAVLVNALVMALQSQQQQEGTAYA
ncbi:MAG: ABC transporter permease [Mangrovicoccus sp.]